MTTLDHTSVLIMVFALPTCGACHEYIPKLTTQIELFQQHGFPFVIYTPGHELQPKEIPVLIYNSGSADKELQALLDQYAIEGLPTTIMKTRSGGMLREEGDLDEQRIYDILATAVAHNQ